MFISDLHEIDILLRIISNNLPKNDFTRDVTQRFIEDLTTLKIQIKKDLNYGAT